MNILLVYPKHPDTFWSFRNVLDFISKKAAFPPLGLLTVAAMLPKDWNVRLVDANVRRLRDEDIGWADMVFVGAMLIQKENTHEVVARCKSMGKTVVAGGPLFTTLQEKFEGVDHFVLNEAEVTLPMFLADLENGQAGRVYTSDEKPDITKTPIPRWDLVDFRDYVTMSVQFSRGCPFNCEFCDIIIMNGRIPRTKTPKQLIAELESLYRAGWRGSLFIVDDNFIGNKKVVKKLLSELIEWQKQHKYPFKFFTEASTNLADDEELMRLMSAANFFKVFLGIETPSVESLNECGKFQNAGRDLGQAVKIIQSHGMQVMGGFIVGFDSDTESIFETQVRFIQQVGIVTAMVGLLNALPQTRLWHRLRDENRLITADPSGENTDGTTNFIPKMGTEKLIAGYKQILSQIYSRRLYYKRIHTFLNNYVPTVRSRPTATDMKAFFKSALRIGVLSRARFLYWKLIIKTLLTKARALPVAVEMAICGLHFEKMSKRVVAGR